MTGLDLSFMRRVYTVGALLTVGAFVCADFLIGFRPALGILAGGAFGIVNMMLLSRAVVALIRPGSPDPLEITVTFTVKFPLALGLMVLILFKGWIDPLGFIIGFPLVFIAVFVLLVAHYYTGAGTRPEKEGDAT